MGDARAEADVDAVVTGATGLLGNNLVRLLVSRGQKVRAVVRSAQKAQDFLGDLDVEVVVRDLEDDRDWLDLVDGAGVVYHTAAMYREAFTGGRQRAKLERVNVEGTRRVAAAAREAGVRLVHVSSSATLRRPSAGEVARAWDLDDPTTEFDDYRRSKQLADVALREMMEADAGLDVRFVLPGWMFGPWDAGPTSSGRLVLDLLRESLPGVVGAGFPVVDARDVAAACIAAGSDRGERGARYLIAGERMMFSEIGSVVGEVAGVRVPHRRLPWSVLFAMAAGSEAVARVNGRDIRLSLAGVRLLWSERDPGVFDSSGSLEELGVTLRNVRETLTQTADWYRERGWV